MAISMSDYDRIICEMEKNVSLIHLSAFILLCWNLWKPFYLLLFLLNLKTLICLSSSSYSHVHCTHSYFTYYNRNKDFQEVILEKDGEVLLRFAATYGFRNIQNLVQKLKRGKSPYHFVEVMACPSGKSTN